MILFEKSRSDLVRSSKSAGELNRFKSRTQINKLKVSRVGVSRPSEDSIHLDLFFEVIGVTDNYVVSMRLTKFFTFLREVYEKKVVEPQRKRGRPARGSDQLLVIKAVIDEAIKSADVQVACTCPDFAFRFAYVATSRGYGFDTNETRPAPIRNPRNKEGVCKHIMKILTRPSAWAPKAIKLIYDLVEADPSILAFSEIETSNNEEEVNHD